ncbi:MFS transporter [Fodinicola feengrottensis]|uniref:MFS transporter n=1 Tax=Fodinicola feengrottensis TaxID=435914 RepID=A0ABN2J5G8_9ACTN
MTATPAPAPPQSRTGRVLAAATLINTFGNGLFMTVSAIYFTRSVGLPAGQLAAALAVAAAARLIASVPMGHLADRVGPREVLVVCACLNGLVTASVVLVDGVVGLALVLAVQGVLDAGSNGARGALIAGALPTDQRVRTQAFLRSMTNLGITGGAAAAALTLHLDTAVAYKTTILADATTFVIAGVMVLGVTRLAPVPAPAGGRRLVALADRPFLLVMLLVGVLTMQYGLLEVAIPLWTVQRTHAPAWLVSVLLIVNTIGIVLFQVRASRDVTTATAAAKALRLSSVIIAVACAIYAFAAGQGIWVAVAIMVAGSVVHVVSELVLSAGTWGVAYGLAPPHAQGQYQGVFGMSMSLGNLVGPALTTVLVLGTGGPHGFGGGLPGWLALGALFVVAGAAAPPVVSWALRTRATAEPVAAGAQ